MTENWEGWLMLMLDRIRIESLDGKQFFETGVDLTFADENDLRDFKKKSGILQEEEKTLGLKIVRESEVYQTIDNFIDWSRDGLRIIINGWETEVEVREVEFRDYQLTKKFMQLKIKMFSPKWLWKKTTKVHFDSVEENFNVDYGRDYGLKRGYNYGYSGSSSDLMLNTKGKVKATVTFFGAVIDPYLILNGRKIGVNDALRDSRDYITINPFEKTVIKREGVQTTNIFSKRLKAQGYSVFDSLDSPVTISSKPGLSFDLALTEERESPRWI